MLAADYEKNFREIQKVHAAALVRDALAESSTIGDLSAILLNKEISPLVRDLPISKVLSAQSFKKLHARNVRSPTIVVPTFKRTAIKTALMRLLSAGDEVTSVLDAKIQKRFDGLPNGFTYRMLRELEVANSIHRATGQIPILWSVGSA